jgi:hypothetical protein
MSRCFIADTTQEIASLEAQPRSPNLDELDREELTARVAEIKEQREVSYEFVIEQAAEIKNALTALSPPAGHDFVRKE